MATARMLDAARDPRTTALRRAVGELRGATSVTAVEYDARRVLPDPPPRPHPDPRPGPSPRPTPGAAPPGPGPGAAPPGSGS
ncbi:hypothetical protein L2X98_26665 [Microbacterium elymi]|uniref:Uncharacterized protein n=1 Tax=Microbacterium elymi TaxID=2909587 RepID=A0ABY5NGE2_9MICO|nr:hypothetical protein [Microbacterium elymi]UUT34267.1 hypothetical protein L2X98_26665 [Microbacterium elymi]